MKVSKVTGYLLLGMILAAGILFFVGIDALAEDVTITTYYPAPYGVYVRSEINFTDPLLDFIETDGNANENWRIAVETGKLNFTTVDDAYGALADRVTFQQNGNVGIGTTGPQSKFTVKSAGSGYNAGLFLGGTTAASILPYNGMIYLSAGTYYEGAAWQYYQSAGASLLGLTETDGVKWYSGTGASYTNVASNVQLWNATGTWVGPSSRTLKENFTQLNPDDILQKIDQLDIARWNFKSEGKPITHIGPVAEDFYRIFKTGDSEKNLATMDSVGVALAGVKALSAKVKTQQQQIEKLQQEVDELKFNLTSINKFQ